MASRVRPLVVVALLVVVASVLGVLALLRFDRPRDSSLDQPLIAPSATPAPAPSAPRVEQLRGHVVDANGDPVSGAHVRVLAGGKGVAETATDGAGRFAFDRLASGLVRVQADHEPEGAVDSAPITISDAPTELTLVLAPAGIDGVVVDGDNGRPIAGVALSVEGVPFTSPSATTDEAGAFHFAAVPFEATAVVAVASGYRASRAVLGPREDEPVPSLRIVLHAAPAVEGDVVDADGMPIHARIVACEGKPFEAQVESGDDGTFQLPPSTVGCAAFALHADMAPSETVPIAEGRRLTLRLGTPGAIAGFVVDDRGQSVDTFSVGIESFVPAHGFVAPPRGTTAFEDGRFRLEHLVPGTYVLTAVTAGRPPVRSDKVVVRSGATTGGVKLIIARGGAIEGRVLDEDHLPVADVELRFDSVSAVARSDAFTKTDASGRYRLEGAPSGPLTVSAHKDGYRHTLVSGLVVASGDTTTKDITLTKGSGFALSGIGANVGHNGDGLAFAGILPGDPAELAGLHPGDRILRIDGEEVGGMSLEDTIQRLRGEPGTVVGITVERSGALVDVTLTRAAVVH